MTGADDDHVSLTGVPETALWTLYNRAEDPGFDDPWATRLREELAYPYRQRFGSPSAMHPMRARVFDTETARFLDAGGGTVVALGEGLQTSYWRIGRDVPWISVDVPEMVALRGSLLPPTGRLVAGSALDLTWTDVVPDDPGPVLVTAEGLLMYFGEADALGLIAACAARFPGGGMLFDTIPPWFSRRTLAGFAVTEHYTAPPMPWGVTVAAMRRLRVPGVVSIRELPWPSGRGLLRRPWPQLAMRIPWLGGQRPAFWAVDFAPAG